MTLSPSLLTQMQDVAREEGISLNSLVEKLLAPYRKMRAKEDSYQLPPDLQRLRGMFSALKEDDFSDDPRAAYIWNK